jgi:hypothetical protein
LPWRLALNQPTVTASNTRTAATMSAGLRERVFPVSGWPGWSATKPCVAGGSATRIVAVQRYPFVGTVWMSESPRSPSALRNADTWNARLASSTIALGQTAASSTSLLSSVLGCSTR